MEPLQIILSWQSIGWIHILSNYASKKFIITWLETTGANLFVWLLENYILNICTYIYEWNECISMKLHRSTNEIFMLFSLFEWTLKIYNTFLNVSYWYVDAHQEYWYDFRPTWRLRDYYKFRLSISICFNQQSRT